MPAGAPLPGQPDRAATRVDQARLLPRLQLSAGRAAARRGARHGEDTDQGRIDQDAGLHGSDLVKNMRDDLHVLTGSYVLDAISDGEREEFERHLQACPSCVAEVRGLRATAARLALARAVTPPVRMEQRVLAATYQTRQLPPLAASHLQASRPASWPRLSSARGRAAWPRLSSARGRAAWPRRLAVAAAAASVAAA